MQTAENNEPIPLLCTLGLITMETERFRFDKLRVPLRAANSAVRGDSEKLRPLFWNIYVMKTVKV